jgi:hypothetical protein
MEDNKENIPPPEKETKQEDVAAALPAKKRKKPTEKQLEMLKRGRELRLERKRGEETPAQDPAVVTKEEPVAMEVVSAKPPREENKVEEEEEEEMDEEDEVQEEEETKQSKEFPSFQEPFYRYRMPFHRPMQARPSFLEPIRPKQAKRIRTTRGNLPMFG